MIERAKATARSIYGEAEVLAATDTNMAARMARHAALTHNEARIHAMVNLARSHPPIPASFQTFDANDWLIGTATGAVEHIYDAPAIAHATD